MANYSVTLQAIPELNFNNEEAFVSSKLILVTDIPEGVERCSEV